VPCASGVPGTPSRPSATRLFAWQGGGRGRGARAPSVTSSPDPSTTCRT
jgi:hypothetical protein